MKILYITTISDTVNSFLIPHIKQLISQGHEVGVAFQIVEEIHPKLKGLPCKIHEIPFQRTPFHRDNIEAIQEIRRLVENEQYQVVHVHTPVASFITRFALRKNQNVKVIYTAHGFHFYKGAPIINWLLYYPMERIASKWTDVLIIINEEDFQHAQKFKLRQNQSLYLLNGVGINLQQFYPKSTLEKKQLREKYGFSGEDFLLIYVAEISQRKNQHFLIHILHKLKEQIPTIKLLLAGDGKEIEKIKKLVSKYELEERVHFLGYRYDIPDLLAISDLAVSTSKQEGLPVNVMEAMACGIPLVVSNCRGNRDLIYHDVNGYVVELGDVNGFAERINHLYKNQGLMKKFSTHNLKNIMHYSEQNVLEKLNKIYLEQLIKGESILMESNLG